MCENDINWSVFCDMSTAFTAIALVCFPLLIYLYSLHKSLVGIKHILYSTYICIKLSYHTYVLAFFVLCSYRQYCGSCHSFSSVHISANSWFPFALSWHWNLCQYSKKQLEWSLQLLLLLLRQLHVVSTTTTSSQKVDYPADYPPAPYTATQPPPPTYHAAQPPVPYPTWPIPSLVPRLFYWVRGYFYTQLKTHQLPTHHSS